MNLTTKFNLILIPVLAVSGVLASYFAFDILEKNAEKEIIDRAEIMMESALAMRSYTVSEIRPLLALQMKREFRPQSVPAYGATQIFETLRTTHPEYTYKEATLNPTNPRNRAVDWETDVVNEFIKDPEKAEIFGQRDTPSGRSLYFAKPIAIQKEGCLACHSTVDRAPESMLKLYGEANGFGWKLNEVVGAQIISVPMSVPIAHAQQALERFVIVLGAVFVAVLIIVNLMLRIIVTGPVKRMASIADEISKGGTDTPEFAESGKDEISVLGGSFNRMRRSLDRAMKMLEE
jgi:protein-histidine pros-kinase